MKSKFVWSVKDTAWVKVAKLICRIIAISFGIIATFIFAILISNSLFYIIPTVYGIVFAVSVMGFGYDFIGEKGPLIGCVCLFICTLSELVLMIVAIFINVNKVFTGWWLAIGLVFLLVSYAGRLIYFHTSSRIKPRE